MQLQGKWSKDSEGYMDFDSSQLQRLYETITEDYHQVYYRYLDELDDEELAAGEAGKEGYTMQTDYKEIDGRQEFATSYSTPSYQMDLWYEMDEARKKRIYEKGFIRVYSK